MKLGLVLVVAVVVAWLALWATNTGLLVYSAATRVPATRDCRYLIGVSVVTRYAVVADRCELITRIR